MNAHSDRLFTIGTRRLLTEKRITGLFLQGTPSEATSEERRAFNVAFDGKTAYKGNGIEFLWGDWLVESLFPSTLYREHGSSLLALLKDQRIWQIAGFSGNWNNSFGRMARPRKTVPEGFVKFMIDRINGRYGSMPLYWFDVEEPEWVCEPLAGRPDIPKTGRTAVSCVMNYGFHYHNGRLSISVVLRHINWSHLWGDVYGGEALLAALCKELEVEPGILTIFANSASMDEPKAARTYLKELQC